jgi:hypothetical protein
LASWISDHRKLTLVIPFIALGSNILPDYLALLATRRYLSAAIRGALSLKKMMFDFATKLALGLAASTIGVMLMLVLSNLLQSPVERIYLTSFPDDLSDLLFESFMISLFRVGGLVFAPRRHFSVAGAYQPFATLWLYSRSSLRFGCGSTQQQGSLSGAFNSSVSVSSHLILRKNLFRPLARCQACWLRCAIGER